MDDVKIISIPNIRKYRFNKFGISGTKGESITEISLKHLGLHSARLNTPYITLFSRLDNFVTTDLISQLFVDKHLIKLRCMRETLHIVPYEIAPIVHSATKSLRLKKCLNYYKNKKVSKRLINQIKGEIIKILKERDMSSTEIENRIIHIIPKLKKELIRFVIKETWELGELCYINTSNDWRKENRVYGLTSKHYKNLCLEMSEDEAMEKLVLLHIKQYGPVSAKDINWWSGINISTIKDIIDENISLFQRVKYQNNNFIMYMLKEEYQKFINQDFLNAEYVSLLAYEDPLLKGYYESRMWYVNEENYDDLFNTIGEVRASIVLNDNIVGIWYFDKHKEEISYELFKNIELTAPQLKLLIDRIDSYKYKLNRKGIQPSLF